MLTITELDEICTQILDKLHKEVAKYGWNQYAETKIRALIDYRRDVEQIIILNTASDGKTKH